MPDRVAELLLETCAAAGALQAFVLLYEMHALADGKEFTAAEAVAHAILPANARLRAAIEAFCGEVSARKLGKALARIEGQPLGALRADCIGNDPAGILWRVSRTKLRRAATDVTGQCEDGRVTLARALP